MEETPSMGDEAAYENQPTRLVVPTLSPGRLGCARPAADPPPRRALWQEQVADEEALRALRAASPVLQEKWEGDDPSKWFGVEWGDGRVRELDLSGCPLKELPAQVGLLTGLTTLDLSYCEQLTALPAELGQLVNLTALVLDDCVQLPLPPGAPADAKEKYFAPPTIAAYAPLLIVEPRKDTPGQLHAFLLATPLAVPPFFKSILTNAAHADWLGKAVQATPDLARLTHPDGRRAIDVAVPACKQHMQAALYLLARYDVDDGPLLHRSATSAVAAADDHTDPKAKPVPRALKAMQGVEQVRAELQGRAEGLAPEHVVAVRAVFADERAINVDDEVWRQAQAAAAELEIEVKIISGLSGSIRTHLFPASEPQESDESVAAESGKRSLKRQPSSVILAEYKFLVVMDHADRSLKHTIDHEHIAGKDFHSIRAIAAELARALGHLHSKDLIQADHKPNNAVAFGGDWRLIDLDVSCKIGQPFGNKVPSSGYCPPEFARVMLQATDGQGKVDGTKLAEYVASEAYDLWSFGIVLYHLIFGRSLWNNDVNDNVKPADLRKLAAVPDAPLRRVLDAALSDGEDPNANVDLRVATVLLRKLLEPDVEKRMAHFPKGMNDVLKEPFFQGADLDAPTLRQILANQEEMKTTQKANHLEVMGQLKAIKQSLNTIDTRLINLTANNHEVRFRYFLLVPKPIDGIAKFNPERLLKDAMLLIPLYIDKDNNLKKAPVNKEALGGQEGFEVSVPTAFVKAHPKLVMISLFVVKMALTAAAAQVGAKVGTLLTFDIDFSGGGSVSTMLEDMAKDTLNRASAELISVDTSGCVTGKVAEVIDNLTTAPEAGLDELLEKEEESGTAPTGRGLTNDQYANLAKWLDDTNPGWKAKLGLTTEPQGNGTLKIVPVAPAAAESAAAELAAAAPTASKPRDTSSKPGCETCSCVIG